jgi:hypothetical protein
MMSDSLQRSLGLPLQTTPAIHPTLDMPTPVPVRSFDRLFDTTLIAGPVGLLQDSAILES